MKKSSMWLGIFVGTLILISVVACCTFIPSATNSNDVYAAGSEVNLEELTKAYENYVKTGKKDVTGFESVVNRPPVYMGKERVSVKMNDAGSVVGYKDDNGQVGYQQSDTQVFVIDADKENEQLVAKDRDNRYYRHRSPGLFTYALMGYMIGSQRSYYGGRYYRPPAGAKYVRSGYHNRLRSSSSSSSSRSFRSGSSGTRRRSGGGFGFGK
jgi:hypothetical protein